ncbi:hypothetical protein KFL_001580070 [Klebsormidium nitens]|uniref:F-box domain-containing protein n=1 Tax=Klebsormidium nitens TaxID=105231 RepID=A0A1Y1HZT2_KLENI|nr:hypothetical protein KFL_001580070 [Klebsormidium nitens]|eukprot:GAQ83693.1 hypothetical protein KFL_001580070 [Klebsormidium nitens]
MSAKPGRLQKGATQPGFSPNRATKASAARAAFIASELKEKAPAVLELPEEVLCRILSHLPAVHDVLNCGQVCKDWLRALRSDVLWRGQYARTWGAEEAARVASSILTAAETRRTVEKLFQSADPPQTKPPNDLNAVSEAGKKGGTPGVETPEVSDTGSKFPVKLEDATAVSASRVARGVGRLTLSSGSKRRSKEKQTAQEEKPAHGGCVWRDAFAARFKAEKKTFLASEIKLAENLRLLTRRWGSHNRGGRALDPCPGMARLVERLQLRFELRINNGRVISLAAAGRHSYQSFPTSLSLKCPPSALGRGLTVQKLLKVEVTAVSERLYSTVRLLQLDSSSVRRSTLVAESPTLSLYEASLYPASATEGGSLVVGTFGPGDNSQNSFTTPRKRSLSAQQGLLDSEDGPTDRSGAHSREGGADSTSKEGTESGSGRPPAGDEEVVLLVLNIPYVDVLWRVMTLGPGYGPREHHRASAHDTDLQYGLHDYHASAQIRSFGKLLWCQDFYRCFHSRRESVPGEKAVFVFLPNEGGMPALFQGVPKLAWRTEAFSGELPGALVLDFVLWDQNNEVAWHCSKVVATGPQPTPASPEFGLPYLEGECSHAVIEDAARGVSLSLDLRVASKDPKKRAGEDILPQSAVTGLRLSLARHFLSEWFGVARI